MTENQIPVQVVRSRRKTMALTVGRDAQVLVRAPLRMPQARIDAFVQTHRDWIERHVAQMRARAEARDENAVTPAQAEQLRAAAQTELPPRVALWAQRTGLSPTAVRITAAQTRWGSCNVKDSICLSWRLMRLPLELRDFIIVHELCHIREKNHGPRFYALLETFLPDWRALNRQLKEHGRVL